MTLDLQRLRQTEIWIAWLRLVAVPWAVLEVGVLSTGYPAGYQRWAWLLTAALAVGAAAFFWLVRRELSARGQLVIGLLALTFDTVIVSAYAFVYSFEPGAPIRQLFFVPLVEAALRYGLAGGLILPLALVPVLGFFEWWRSDRFGPDPFSVDHVTFQLGVMLLMGAIVGWLVERLKRETALAETRASEAEELRDELGHRADLIDAANRCARALASSLELEQAFAAFIRELRGLLPFDRMAIVLAEDRQAQVIASAGAGAKTVFPAGSGNPLIGTLLEQVLAGQPVYRADMEDRRYPEEAAFLELGLRCRLAAPLLAGTRTIGMISLARVEPDSFNEDEIELLSLLGRFVASAVQNIRSYEAERTTVEELRRLSALRADFVSLVSHELRSPMAAVIGSARTLQERWRSLTTEQRDSFLELIAHETNRLSVLIEDVLDTSRIEAGTFSYTFSDVDIAELVRESIAASENGQDEVRLNALIREPLPHVRGDRERLRQVLSNLIENAVKYSPSGGEVEVEAHTDNGSLRVEVRDRGPGIASEHQKLIFEKFGRAQTGVAAKPGTGLGLFIARSIAEAHGGTLQVSSVLEQGSTFTFEMPLS